LYDSFKQALWEELGTSVEIRHIHQAVFKRYEGFNILLLACQCRVTEESPSSNGCGKFRWLGKG
jgi:hypothetical protein